MNTGCGKWINFVMDSARRQTVMRLMCGVFFEVGLNPDLRKSTLQLVLKFLITFAAMLSE